MKKETPHFPVPPNKSKSIVTEPKNKPNKIEIKFSKKQLKEINDAIEKASQSFVTALIAFEKLINNSNNLQKYKRQMRETARKLPEQGSGGRKK